MNAEANGSDSVGGALARSELIQRWVSGRLSLHLRPSASHPRPSAFHSGSASLSIRAFALSVCFLVAAGAVGAQDLGTLVEQARTGEEAGQAAAREALSKLGPAAVPPLFTRLAAVPGADDVPTQLAANAVVQAAARAGPPAVRHAMATALLAEAAKTQGTAARRYALELASYVAGPENVEALVALLKDSEVDEMARWTLARIPGEAADRALLAALPASDRWLKVGLLDALGQRGVLPAVAPIRAELRSADEATRLAALGALGRIPDPTSEATLRALLTRGTAREQAAATDAYLRLADSLVARAYSGRGTGNRQNDLELPLAIYRWAADLGPHTAVRVAGMVGLVRASAGEALGAVLVRLEKADPALRGAAIAALSDTSGITVAVARALDQAKPEAKRILIEMIGRRGSRAATPTLMKVAQDPDLATAAAAIAALGRIRDPAAADLLLRLAEYGPAANRPAAVQALLAVGGALEDRQQVRFVFERGLRLATTDEERTLALRGLAAVAEAASLPLVEPYLAAGALRAEAAPAAARIAVRLAQGGSLEKGTALLQQALNAAGTPELRRSVLLRLRSLGITVEVGGGRGHIARWHVLGPLAGRQRWTRADAFDPKAELDLKKSVSVDGRDVPWKEVAVTDPDGVLDLEQAVARQDDAVAYLYTEIESKAEQSVQFKIGSDDGFVLWVNGERAGEHLGDRAYMPDQDSIPARLIAGKNRILLKITQGGGQWAAGVRITNPDGSPFKP